MVTHFPDITRPTRNRGRSHTAHKTAPDEKPVDNAKIPLDTASYKLYYVNYKMGLE